MTKKLKPWLICIAPRCKDVALKISRIKDIEIDYCPKCFGIWLDRGELKHIIERTQTTSARKTQPGRQAPTRKEKDSNWNKTQTEESFLEDVIDFFIDFI